MSLLRRLLGCPDVPVSWERKYSNQPGELGVYCLRGWQYVELPDSDMLRIAEWLKEKPDLPAFNLTVGTGYVQEVVLVDRYAMPFLRAVVEAVAQEIKAMPVPVVQVEEEVPHG